MKVKELKTLLADVDENLDVMIMDSKDGTDEFISVNEAGVVEFGEPCDEKGVALPDINEPFSVFIVSFHTLFPED